MQRNSKNTKCFLPILATFSQNLRTWQRTAVLSLMTLLICISTFSTTAASLRMSPIRFDLPASQRTATLTLVNTGSEPVNLQLRAFNWSQTNGEDVLNPTNDLMVSPPAATVPPGASYTVRIARSTTKPVIGEQSYRLLIDELPKPTDPRTVSQALSIVLRTSIPVFFADPQAKAQLTWQLWRDDNGLHAEVSNNGNRHAQISGLAVQAGNRPLLPFGSNLNGYVLANSSKRFDLPVTAATAFKPGETVTLTANNGPLDINETLQVRAR